jgi:formate C-acetyltransferase
MYTQKPITPRVQRIRERYRETMPKICTARYRLITDFYKQNPKLTGILKRARAMKYIFDNIPVRIEADDLIVGAQGTTFRSCALYPEYGGIGMMAREIQSNNIQTRKYDPYLIDKEDGDYIVSTAEFWDAEGMGSYTRPYMFDGYFAHDGSGTTTHGTFGVSGPVGHFCTGYNTAIRKGFAAIKAEADAKMKKLEDDGVFGKSAEQYYFYKAVSLVSEGMIGLTKRYAAEARRMAGIENSPERREELLRMAECLDWTMEHPSRNFHEAVQCIFMYETCLAFEGNMHGMSLGRVDQYLGDYYERDIANGVLTPEYGQEILDTFYLKLAEMNKYWGDGGEMGQPGYTSGQLITLGGIKADGTDASNEVTYMMLQSSARLILHEPPQALRVHKDTPDELWEAAIETTKICGGVPSFENDEIIIPSLTDRGLPLESARNYCLIGCVEPGGTGDEWPACGGDGGDSYWNLVNALWLAINNGTNPLPVFRFNAPPMDPRQTGILTGYLYEMNTFEDVLEAFRKQVEYFVKWHVSCTNNFEYIARDVMPLPVVSATMDGCMDKGADVMYGGARYNSTGLSGVGIGNVADSLQMIKHLCFDKKICTTRELYDALINDWEGHEELYDYVKNQAPHYGNADPDADKWAGWAAGVFADAVNSSTGPRGGYRAGLYPVTTNVAFGMQTAATPDGRKKGEPLADGISPVQQMDKNGPTAVLASVSAIDQRKFGNGTLLNMKFHPSTMNSDDSIAKLRNLLKTYFFDLLGMEVQLNIVSSATMRAAQEDPVAYKDLVVRIAGFSVYFIEMHRAGQNDLISRTELMLQ